jgi:hypothetical protein
MRVSWIMYKLAVTAENDYFKSNARTKYAVYNIFYRYFLDNYTTTRSC